MSIYKINTGVINLSTENSSAVFFLQNNGNYTCKFGFQLSCRFDYRAMIDVVVNPTGGTIISNAVDVSCCNSNFGSSEKSNVTVYKGAEGNTLTGGQLFKRIYHDSITFISYQLLSRESLGIIITPNNYNMEILIIGDLMALPV